MSLPSCQQSRAVSSLRRRVANINLIAGLQPEEQSSLPLTVNKQIEEAKKILQESTPLLEPTGLAGQPDLTLRGHNLQQKPKTREVTTPSGRNQQPRKAIKTMCLSMSLQKPVDKGARPRSSYREKTEKPRTSIGANYTSSQYQNRPGSSKSSRSFKRRQPQRHQKFDSDNEESCMDDIIIMTKTEGRETGPVRRSGVSTSGGHRENKAIKLDPEFLKLFAQ